MIDNNLYICLIIRSGKSSMCCEFCKSAWTQNVFKNYQNRSSLTRNIISSILLCYYCKYLIFLKKKTFGSLTLSISYFCQNIWLVNDINYFVHVSFPVLILYEVFNKTVQWTRNKEKLHGKQGFKDQPPILHYPQERTK